MAFLDNSGDIILDAVLTDTGRLRMAQGDGSFKISKFALGDDEINYGLYNKDHASGSAYYDLEVLQTPTLEAFTNNTSNLKTKLVSVSRTNILYMPVLKLNEVLPPLSALDDNIQGGPSAFFRRPSSGDAGAAAASDSKFYIAVDVDTWYLINRYYDDPTGGTASNKGIKDKGKFAGVIQGYTVDTGDADGRHLIRVDQGLDTNEIAPVVGLDSDLLESAFIVEMDYRLGRVKGPSNHTPEAVNFIDDDNVAQYYLTSDTYINPMANSSPADATDKNQSRLKTDLDTVNPQVFEGPRGKSLQFRIHASQDLAASTYLFTQLGSSEAATGAILGLGDTLAGAVAASSKTVYYIDSTVRVIGANTGYRLDIPVRYIKIA
jgi:hypothetical protein|tara:strand:+ start:800 stop:1930 length:1131 start_codon:yes stop_codon:yes gene_type:complete